jgi:hypothetical protein
VFVWWGNEWKWLDEMSIRVLFREIALQMNNSLGGWEGSTTYN